MKKATAKKIAVPLPTTLAERLDSLLEEVEDFIDEHVDRIAAQTPGVPHGVIKQMAFAKGSGCRRQTFRAIVKGKH